MNSIKPLDFQVSGFSFIAYIERSYCARTLLALVLNLYLSELLLITHNVLLKRHKQAFGMFGCQNDTAAYLCLWHSWQHSGEVQHEVAA